MATGYLIAVLLEAAGLIGLALAARTIQAERRTRAIELRGFLSSGQPVAAEPVPVPRRGHVRRASDLPISSGRAEARRDEASTARDALLRALARDGSPLPRPISAG